jgi:hypothetical protein
MLAVHDGTAVSGPAVSDWERGVSAPDQRNVTALEAIFEEPLAELLGYSGGDPGVYERLGGVEERLTRLETLFDAMGDEIRRLRAAAEGLGDR